MLYIYKILVVNWLVVLKICEDLITLYTGFIDLTIRPRASMLFKVAFPPPNNTYHSHLYRPSRTFKLRFGGVSREFGRAILKAIVRILMRRSRAKIPITRTNQPDIPPKRAEDIFTVRKFSQVSTVP